CLEDAEIGWALDRHYVAGFCHRAQSEIQRFETSVGYHHVFRTAIEAGIELEANDLPAESRVASEVFVNGALQRMARGSAAQGAIELAIREQFYGRCGDPKRNEISIVDPAQHIGDQFSSFHLDGWKHQAGHGGFSHTVRKCREKP